MVAAWSGVAAQRVPDGAAGHGDGGLAGAGMVATVAGFRVSARGWAVRCHAPPVRHPDQLPTHASARPRLYFQRSTTATLVSHPGIPPWYPEGAVSGRVPGNGIITVLLLGAHGGVWYVCTSA